MTALAKLVAYWRKRAPDLVPYTVAADQLEAALSPADLGGAIGYVSQSSLDALIACRNDAHNGYAEVWMRQTDTFTVPVYTTPRAAEVVTDEIVDSVRADIMQAAANDGRLHIVLKDEWVRAALTVALTPPSAKGE